MIFERAKISALKKGGRRRRVARLLTVGTTGPTPRDITDHRSFKGKPPGLLGGLLYQISHSLSFSRHHAIKVQLHFAVHHAAHTLNQAMRLVVLLPAPDDFASLGSRRHHE